MQTTGAQLKLFIRSLAALWPVVVTMALASAAASTTSGCESGSSRAHELGPERAARARAAALSEEERKAQAPPKGVATLENIDGPGLLARVRQGSERAVLVNVWASWCDNCKKELPIILRVADDVRERGIGLMLVSADEPKERAKATSFLRQHGGGRPGFFIVGSMEPFKRALHPTWKGSVPSTFLLSNEGRLLHSWLGPVLERELRPVLESFLAGTLAEP